MIRMFLLKVRLYALLCVLLCGSMAEKERLEDGYSEESLADRLISVIEKRLEDYDREVAVNTPSTSHSCEFNIEPNNIIKTHDSLEAGAHFIDNIENLSTREECEQKCCESETCNLAVFKEKDGHSCYLFDCGMVNVCNFTHHEDFSVMRLGGTALQEQVQAKHENDLAQLVTKAPPTTSTTTTTTVATTTTSTTTTPKPTEKKAPVGLFGECEQNQECAGAGTECLAGYCVCQEGFHAQDGVCPQAPQNGKGNDGSGTGKDQGVDAVDTAGEMTRPVSDAKPQDSQKQDSTNEGSDQPSDQEDNTEQHNAEQKSGQPEQPAEDSNTQSGNKLTDNTDNKPSQSEPGQDGKESLKQGQNETSQNEQSGDSPNEHSDNDNTGSKEDSDSKQNGIPDDDKDSDGKEVDSDNDNSKDVTEKKSGVVSSRILVVVPEDELNAAEKQSSSGIAAYNQGAVIALALGLAVTAMLLMFVGCRLRMVKRRLRRGRPLSSGEADYLINGMYL